MIKAYIHKIFARYFSKEHINGNQDLSTLDKKSVAELEDLLAAQEFRFQPYFSSRLMNKLQVEPTGILSGLNYAFMRISVPTMLALLVWVMVFWGLDGSLTVDGLLGISELSYDELLDDFYVSN